MEEQRGSGAHGHARGKCGGKSLKGGVKRSLRTREIDAIGWEGAGDAGSC